MSTLSLLEKFQAWRNLGTTLALATVIETAGSTYTKAGHRILLAGAGDYQGLVSGGCLENDLALHAEQVIATGEPRIVTYDLRQESDELFGLGVGCDGWLRILLQRLSAESGYAPFTTIAQVLDDEVAGTCAVVTEGSAISPGATVVVAGDQCQMHGLAPDTGATLARRCRAEGPLPRLESVPLAGEEARVLVAPLRPVPRLLLLGAGPDAVAVVTLAAALGWRVTVMDHRPAYLERVELAAAFERVCAPAADLARQPGLQRFAAAVVMSHHRLTDRTYLAALAGSPIPYIGLLGPKARRERLLRELGPDAPRLGSRLHGPAGLDIGADSPETIALAIWAQIQALGTRAS